MGPRELADIFGTLKESPFTINPREETPPTPHINGAGSLDNIQWDIIPTPWVEDLKAAVESIVFRWIPEIQRFLKYYSDQKNSSNGDKHALELQEGIHDLWTRWKNLKNHEVDHLELSLSPIYFDFEKQLHLVRSPYMPKFDSGYTWALRLSCRKIIAEMEQVKSFMEEVAMRVTDMEKEGPREWKRQEIDYLLVEIPVKKSTLPDEILQYLDNACLCGL